MDVLEEGVVKEGGGGEEVGGRGGGGEVGEVNQPQDVVSIKGDLAFWIKGKRLALSQPILSLGRAGSWDPHCGASKRAKTSFPPFFRHAQVGFPFLWGRDNLWKWLAMGVQGQLRRLIEFNGHIKKNRSQIERKETAKAIPRNAKRLQSHRRRGMPRESK